MTSPAFTNIVAALAWWEVQQRHGRDTSPLRAATVPPCDVLGDEEYDLRLAVIFRDLVALDGVTLRSIRIQDAISVQLPMIEYCRERGYSAVADRLQRMLDVLERWNADVLDAVPAEDAAA